MAATRTRRRLVVIGSVTLSVVLLAALATATAGHALSLAVQGRSMAPTIEPGHRILTDPFAEDYTPARLDIVVARPKPDSSSVVKRIVGLPGDRVRVSGGRALVQPGGAGPWRELVVAPSGDPWSRTPRVCCSPDGRGTVDAPATVPAGHTWLLGDNLPVSEDSRAYGFVPVTGIEGPLWLRTWPIGSAAELVAAAELRALP
ncbi:signal peptidase I [Actinokineospora sp. 24-640]